MGFFTTGIIKKNKDTCANSDVEMIECGVSDIEQDDHTYQKPSRSSSNSSFAMGEDIFHTASGIAHGVSNKAKGLFTNTQYRRRKRQEELETPFEKMVKKYGVEESINMVGYLINGLLYVTEYNDPKYANYKVVMEEKHRIIDSFWEIYSSIAISDIEEALHQTEMLIDAMLDNKNQLPMSLFERFDDMEYTDNPHPRVYDYTLEVHGPRLVQFSQDALHLVGLLLNNYEKDKESGLPQVNAKLYDLTYSILYEDYELYQTKYNEMYEYFENRYKNLSGNIPVEENSIGKKTTHHLNHTVKDVRDRLAVIQLDYVSAVTFTGHNAEYIFTAPAILDSSVPTTGAFLDAMYRAQMTLPDDDFHDDNIASATIINAIEEAEHAWKEAVRFARTNINNPLRGSQQRRARKLLDTILLIDVNDPEHKNARDALIAILDGITYDIPAHGHDGYRTVALYTKDIFDPDTFNTNRKVLSSTRQAITS